MRKYTKQWPIIILIANIAYFFAYNSYFSFNFPIQDDVTLVEFIVAKEQKKTEILSLLGDLFRVDNDHSLAIPRLIVWLNQDVEGAVDFKHINQYIILALIAFFASLTWRFTRLNLRLDYLLPIGFLLFQPHFYEVINWPIAGLQHIHILLFVIITLVLLEKSKSLLGPILCAFLAGFTFGNGVALFVLIAVYLFFEGRKKEVLWAFSSLGIYLLALLPIFNFSQHAKFGFSLLNTSFFTFGILGSLALEFTKSQDVYAICFGAFIFGCMSYFVYQKWVKKNRSVDSFYFYLLIFVVGATLVISIPRSGDDWTFFHSSRYFVYGVIALICLYVLGIDYLAVHQKKFLYYPMLLFSLAFCFLSYYNNTTTMADRMNSLRADHDNWKRYQVVICNIPQVYQNIKPILNQAYENQWLKDEPFLIPSEDLPGLDRLAIPMNSTVPMDIQNHADTIRGKSEYWVNRFSYILFNRLPFDNPISKSLFLIVQHDSTNKSFISPVSFTRGAIRSFILKPGSNYLFPSGASLLHTEFLAAGKYNLYLAAVEDRKKNVYYKLNRSIEMRDIDRILHLNP